MGASDSTQDEVKRGDLRVRVSGDPDEAVLTLVGELDVSNVDRLSAAVTEVLATGVGRVVLDLAGLTFCDSRGLGTLIVLSRAAQLQQSFLVLRHPSPSFARTVEITGVQAGLNITE